MNKDVVDVVPQLSETVDLVDSRKLAKKIGISDHASWLKRTIVPLIPALQQLGDFSIELDKRNGRNPQQFALFNKEQAALTMMISGNTEIALQQKIELAKIVASNPANRTDSEEVKRLRAENEALKQIALERDRELETVQAHAQGLLKILKKIKAPLVLQGNEFMVQACIEAYVNGRDEKLPTLALQPPEDWAKEKPNKEMKARTASGKDALISPQERRLNIDSEVAKLLPSKQPQSLL